MAEEKNRRIKSPDVWREAKGVIVAHRSRLALGAVLMLISRLTGLVLPASSKYIIDEVIVKGRIELMLPIALAAGAATLLQSITSFLLSQLLSVAAERAITEMRRRVQAHVQRLPISYFDSTQSGKLLARIMTDAEGVRNLVGSGLVQLSGSIVTSLLSVGLLFYLNWRLTAFTIIAMAGFSGGMAYAFKRLRPIFRERGELYSQVAGRLTESLSGIRVVKAYIAEKREELVFARNIHRLFRNVRKSITGVSMVTALSSIITGLIGMVMIVVGGHAVRSGQMTLGDLFIYIFFTGLMTMPVVEVAGMGPQITQAIAGLDRIRELLNMSTEDEEDASKSAMGEIQGEIEFEDIWFEYKAGVPVLKSISFKAPAGSTTALVGPSGSGKSTLISLIMSFNRPLSGQIKIDGRDLSMIKQRDFRSHLGVVLQDNFLFDGTIAENISFSKPQASQEEIRAVSRIAHCEEFIEGFDSRYDTIVGERGVKLSGGQRQRIAIARALLADPKILVMDEATSSLDSESEELIQVGLRSLRQGRTTFVIAHRLSTIRNADQILVLEHGEIVERGTHETLLASGGRYKQLYDKQYKSERGQFINPGENETPEPSKAEIGRETHASQIESLTAKNPFARQGLGNSPDTEMSVYGLAARVGLLSPVNFLLEAGKLMFILRKKKLIIVIGLLLAVMSLAGLLMRRDDRVEIQTAKVERRAVLESKVTVNGEVRPVQFNNLTAEVSGRVVEVLVKEGDQVKKGQPLLRVDPAQLASSVSIQEASLRASQSETQNQRAVVAAAENSVNTAQTTLNASQADLERSNVERTNAGIELKRNADLLKSGINSQSAYDTAKMRFDTAVASVAAAAARVEQSKVQLRDAEIRVQQARATLDSSMARVAQQQAGLDQATDQLRKTTQYATIDGVVVGPIVQVGTFAIANFQSTGLLLIADMSMINVEVRVGEVDIANIEVGQKARVRVDAIGKPELEGEITEKAAAAQTRTGQTIAQTAAAVSQEAKDFRVVIRLNRISGDVCERLRPGMSATAVITTGRRENIIAVPLQSLVERDSQQIRERGDQGRQNQEQRPKDSAPIKGVFVIDNNRVVFSPVETGITGDDDIEIKSGLKEGQQIVAGPYRWLRMLRNNRKVKPGNTG